MVMGRMRLALRSHLRMPILREPPYRSGPSNAARYERSGLIVALADAVSKALQSHRLMSEHIPQHRKVFDDVAEALLPEIYERLAPQCPAQHNIPAGRRLND